MSRFSVLVMSILMSVIGLPAISEAASQVYDIVVYGGSCSGITAAIQAKRMGRSVVLLCPEEHVGGLTISGLGWTDTKDVNAIGGLAREFYHRIWQYYTDPAKWVYQQRSSYTSYVTQSGLCIQDDSQTMWTFEPHVA
ncbi:MAG: FAD-dependent oxidoreductase, partial [Sedimentisphaerales bacterium]|nr:FAD-dependent oxidoreductase [Sedimentisphaerales bacterium]